MPHTSYSFDARLACTYAGLCARDERYRLVAAEKFHHANRNRQRLAALAAAGCPQLAPRRLSNKLRERRDVACIGKDNGELFDRQHRAWCAVARATHSLPKTECRGAILVKLYAIAKRSFTRNTSD